MNLALSIVQIDYFKNVLEERFKNDIAGSNDMFISARFCT